MAGQMHIKFSKGDNKMLGMGLLGTIIVIVFVVWLIRRV